MILKTVLAEIGTCVQEIQYDYNNNREHAYHQLDLLDTYGEGQKWSWIFDGIELTSDESYFKPPIYWRKCCIIGCIIVEVEFFYSYK